MTKVGIIGAGNFGFALTYHLARKHDDNLEIWLYDHCAETAAYIERHRVHPKFYPTVDLPESVKLTADLAPLVAACDVLVLAMVSTALENVLAQLPPLIAQPVTIVSVMKALDNDTGAVLTEIIEQKLTGLPVKTAVLAGGTTGEALTQEQYLGATFASRDQTVLSSVAPIFASPYLQIQTSTDILGVQLASSLKNVISLLVGMLTGLGFNYGTQTHGLSLIAHECEQLSVSLGAQPTTFNFISQCWGNDMVMSATGDTRNHQLGVLLGEGLKFDQAVTRLEQAGKTAESKNTLVILDKIIDLRHYPLLQFLVQLSQHQVATHQVVKLIETYPL